MKTSIKTLKKSVATHAIGRSFLYMSCFVCLCLSTAFGIETLENIQSLKDLDHANHGDLYQIRHHSLNKDEGGGLFRYDAGSSKSGNDGTVVDPIYIPGRFLRTEQGPMDVKWFGAVGDGSTDDSAAIQAALDAMVENPAITFSQGTYLVRTSLKITKSNKHKSYSILGAGATLHTDRDIAILSRVPTDINEAKKLASTRFFIDGLTFTGTKLSQQKGIELGASYGTVVSNCSFSALGTAVDLMFALMGKIENCIATLCVTDGFVLRSGYGVFTTGHNAHSNHASIRNCRVYAAEGAHSSYKILAANGVKIEHCIAEGKNPENNLVFDNLGATTIKSFYLSNFHSENHPTNAVLNLQSGGGIMAIEGLWMQHSNLTAIHMKGTQSTIQVSNMPYLPKDTVLRNTGNHQWRFYNCGYEANNAEFWHENEKPKYMVSNYRSTSGSPLAKVSTSESYIIETGHTLQLNSKFKTNVNSEYALGKGGSTMIYHKKYTKDWNPPALAPKAFTSQIFDISGTNHYQHLGLTAFHNKLKGNMDLIISINVHDNDKVKVVIYNPSDKTVDIPNGQLDIGVTRYR